METLSREQEEVVRFNINCPLLIQSPPGSGKTHTLTARIIFVASELRRASVPGTVLALTFSSNAAKEMSSRIVSSSASTGLRDRPVDVKTFHSFCYSVLKHNFFRMGFSSKPSLCPVKMSNDLLLESIKSKCSSFDPSRFKAFKKCIAYGKCQIDPEKYFAENCPEILSIYRDFQKRLYTTESIEFSDMLQLTVRILNENPDILETIRFEYPAVVVDEFQDTSGLQFELVKLLCSKHRRVTVVGDIDQLIYSFQGADEGNFKNFLSSFSKTGDIDPSSMTLRTNYRSLGPVVLSSNMLVTRKSDGMIPAAGKELGPPVALVECHGNSMYDFILSEISFLVSKNMCSANDIAVLYRNNETGSELKEYLKKNKQNCMCKFKFGDNSSNQWMSNRFNRFLSTMRMILNPKDNAACENSLPFVGKKASGILSSTIEDIKSYVLSLRQKDIESIDSSHNFKSFFLFESILDSKCKALQNWASRLQSISERIREDSGVLIKRCVEIAADISNTRHRFIPSRPSGKDNDDVEEEDYSDDIFDENFVESDIMTDILNEADNWDRTRTARGLSKNPEDFVLDLENFVDMIAKTSVECDKIGTVPDVKKPDQKYFQMHSKSISVRDEPRSDAASSGVWLGTVHKAKGLQWKVVFILKADNECFPYRQISDESDSSKVDNDNKESRRILYVAMTRAEERLYCVYQVSSAQHRPTVSLSPLLYPVRDVARQSQSQQVSSFGQLVAIGFMYPRSKPAVTGATKPNTVAAKGSTNPQVPPPVLLQKASQYKQSMSMNSNQMNEVDSLRTSHLSTSSVAASPFISHTKGVAGPLQNYSEQTRLADKKRPYPL